ncbi:hypothetical protein SAY86_009220 [Trapa natans]|uniref:Uncharacterized protein n=1 Tax=Trapa natans TaxID=22666 RepID=A0AAN7KWF4_TRANT|nr:hypothetical protein SAY86_009220 [Trapa natans]
MGSPPPPADTNADNSAAEAEVDGDSKDGVFAAVEAKKSDLSSPIFEDLNQFEDIDKYKKYEADYTCRLMAKYFSNKNVCGGDIFDETVTVDGFLLQVPMLTLSGSLKTLVAVEFQFLNQEKLSRTESNHSRSNIADGASQHPYTPSNQAVSVNEMHCWLLRDLGKSMSTST